MVEYEFKDAINLLGKNLKNAEAKIADVDIDVDFIKD